MAVSKGSANMNDVTDKEAWVYTVLTLSLGSLAAITFSGILAFLAVAWEKSMMV